MYNMRETEREPFIRNVFVPVRDPLASTPNPNPNPNPNPTCKRPTRIDSFASSRSAVIKYRRALNSPIFATT